MGPSNNIQLLKSVSSGGRDEGEKPRLENSQRIPSKEISRSSATIMEPADYFWTECKSRHLKVVVSLLPLPLLTIENKDRTRNGREKRRLVLEKPGKQGGRGRDKLEGCFKEETNRV